MGGQPTYPLGHAWDHTVSGPFNQLGHCMHGTTRFRGHPPEVLELMRLRMRIWTMHGTTWFRGRPAYPRMLHGLGGDVVRRALVVVAHVGVAGVQQLAQPKV